MQIDKCAICNNHLNPCHSDDIYLKCVFCGHEFLNKAIDTPFIINDNLNLKTIEELSALDAFKIRTALSCSDTKSGLIDIGSGSGKFLFTIKNLFKNISGLEITPECVDFSKKLNLKIYSNISDINFSEIHTITAWHSLEHIKVEQLNDLFKKIQTDSAPKSKILVSVPNVASFQYKFFKSYWPYYDATSHVHQFSPNSLDIFLNKFDIKFKKNHFSFSYSFFGYLQGFVNLFNYYHNYFYYRKKRGWSFNLSNSKKIFLDFYNYVLLLAFSPLSIILVFFDYLNLTSTGVITRCYQKNH